MKKYAYVICSDSPEGTTEIYKVVTDSIRAWDLCVELQKEFPEFDFYYSCVDLEEEK